MTPEQYVTALYELCLGRGPDPEGLATWSRMLTMSNDPTAVLAALLDSEERGQWLAGTHSAESTRLARQAAGLQGRSARIVDVGAQSLEHEEHVYAPLAAFSRLDIVGFDPLDERLTERALAEADPTHVTLLPYAIGDGEMHTLYVNNDDATSSLFPLNQRHNAPFNHLSSLHTVQEVSVRTHRLDDVLPPGPVDLLKLDVQGAELMIIRGAGTTLRQTAVVHCEVEFAPIYSGQPLFRHVDSALTDAGFYLVDLLTPVRYHYLEPPGVVSKDRLLWGEAVWFRETTERDMLIAQALIAAGVYAKPSLAAHLMERAAAATP